MTAPCTIRAEAQLGGLSGPQTDIDTSRLIAASDAGGIPNWRVTTRFVVAECLVSRGDRHQAALLLQDALEILQPGVNLNGVVRVQEHLALAADEPSDSEGDNIASSALRLIELRHDSPFATGFGLVGLLVTTDPADRHHDAALLAGYIAGHLVELGLPATTADTMAGRPLTSFVTTDTRAEFDRGRAMTAADLDTELARLAQPT